MAIWSSELVRKDLTWPCTCLDHVHQRSNREVGSLQSTHVHSQVSVRYVIAYQLPGRSLQNIILSKQRTIYEVASLQMLQKFTICLCNLFQL